MGDPEEPTSLTPCLAQRNGSQEAGEKDGWGALEAKADWIHRLGNHVGREGPVDAALSRLTTYRHTPTPPSTSPIALPFLQHLPATPTATALHPHACFVCGCGLESQPTRDVQRWQCKYDYCTFVVAIIRLTRGFSLCNPR